MRYTLVLFVVVLFLNGCTLKQVQPWERETLARKKMQLVDSPLDAYLEEHIYFSKEASSGGAGVGGGGCGCN